MGQDQNAPDMSAEQAADLAALEAAAGGGEMPQAEEAAPGMDQAQQWAMLPAIVGSALSMALPELRAVYTPQACEAWGAAMVPVADKYGWNCDGIIGPEMALFAASVPFAFGTYSAIKARRAEDEKKAEEKPRTVQAAPVIEPGPVTTADIGKTVVVGAPVA